MKGSEFIAALKDRSPTAWDAAILQAARDGNLLEWPWAVVELSIPGHQATARVMTDYVAVGTPDDHVRVPMRPETAQGVANLGGMLLPTPWLARRTWEQAPIKIEPIQGGALSAKTNLYNSSGARSVLQYAEHDQKVTNAIAGREGQLASGQKKDIVVNKYLVGKPGKVVIYGWFHADTKRPYKESMDAAVQQPIQPRSDFHAADYYDYSHGARLVAPTMIVDGREVATESVYRDPVLSKLVSDEGPLAVVRYPSPVPIAPVRPADQPEYVATLDTFQRPSLHGSLTDRGVAVIVPKR